MRRGFTLLELLIVVVVIGVLATIAIPQYLTAVERARVGKAKNALGLMAQAEKMYRADRDTYTNVFGNLSPNYVEMQSLAADPDWLYTIPNATANTFTVQASRAAGAYPNATVTLDQDGVCAGTHVLRGADCGG